MMNAICYSKNVYLSFEQTLLVVWAQRVPELSAVFCLPMKECHRSRNYAQKHNNTVGEAC